MHARRTGERWARLERDQWLAWYAERGLATVPVVPRGKRPLRAGWQRAGAAAWVNAPPDANLGVVCGAPSRGLVVLDFDTADGIHDAMGMRPEALAVHTVVVRTRRGWHVYAREAARRTSSPWRGLDVRAEGSLVVAPPSVHPTGVSYEILRPDVGVAALASLPIELEAPAPARPAEIDWEAAEEWVALQAPKLRGSWRVLRTGAPDDFDRSRADFAVARCFFERGDSVDEIAALLLALPGSKARERGAEYALRTATRAASLGVRSLRGRG